MASFLLTLTQIDGFHLIFSSSDLGSRAESLLIAPAPSYNLPARVVEMASSLQQGGPGNVLERLSPPASYSELTGI